MADRWSAFHAAVKHSLDGWPALHIAHQQGFGGENFKEKIEWLLEVIVQTFKDNDLVYPDELEDYISECLYNEFDIIVDDGTCPKVVEKLCGFNQLCATGQFAKVLEELRVPPPTCPPVASVKTVANESESEDEESDDELQVSTHSMQNPNSDESITNSSFKQTDPTQSNEDGMELDNTTPMEGENEEDAEGWEVVRRSKHKGRSRKSK